MTIHRSDIIRSFIAVYPDDAAQSAIARLIDCMRGHAPDIRWEKSGQIHVTMKFIGDIERRDILAVAERLRLGLGTPADIRATIDRIGAFPGPGNPRIVWLGFSEPVPPLLSLQASIEDACEAADIPRERKRFTPHVTIGRVREGRPAGHLEKLVDSCSFPPTPVTFSALRFMQSTLTPAGAIHREIGRIPFSPIP